MPETTLASEPVVVLLALSALAATMSSLGALPFLRQVTRPDLVGIAEALASGLMLGAAHLLMTRGLDRGELWSLIGAAFGVGYTLLVQAYAGTAELEDDEDGDPGPEFGYKTLLQQALHSSSEGVAMGVAFLLDLRLGVFLAAALALHNIAEGVALAAVLRRRGLPASQAAGLCVVSNLTQPLFALATFALAPVLEDLLPAGLGFAAGCLAFLVLTELLPDAYHKGGKRTIATLVTVAAGLIVLLEDFLGVNGTTGLGLGGAVLTVFLLGLITALATGLGALPFAFLKGVSPRRVALANAIASGLMLGASFGLLIEGRAYGLPQTIVGAMLGMLFIIIGQQLLAGREVSFGDLRGAGARQVLLILGVMTLHSFSEGVAVGVAFGGGQKLANLITIAIAVHNVPEGLAISAVMRPKGASVMACAGWSVFSSLPQPLMAVPAFLFVEAFRPVLPYGLGFAAGAMVFMVLLELLPDAYETIGRTQVGVWVSVSLGAMVLFQNYL